MTDETLDLIVKRAGRANADKLTQTKPERPKGAGKLPWFTYLTGLGADAATTLYGTKSGKTVERNPLMPKGAGGQAAAFGGELAAMLVARKLLKNHPGVMKAGLFGLGGAHGLAAAGNVGAMRQPSAPASSQRSIGEEYPNLVQLPDGSWVDPSLIR